MNRTMIFDMDGVIFDTERLIWQIWTEVAEKHGIKDIEKTLKACLGTNVVETKEIFLRDYGKGFAYDDFRKEAGEAFFKKVKTDGMPVKEGVRELLAYLKEKNYRIALASSTRVALVKEELQQAGLTHYFEKIIGGDMVRCSKPHPEIYLMACREMMAVPAETMAIEDSFNGIRSAHAAGLKTIMVPDIMQPDEEISSMLFKKCDSLLEVRDFLAQQETIGL